MNQTTHVVLSNDVFEYAEKAPYSNAGFGDFGALRYDAISGRVQCHECGEWYQHLGAHIAQTHLTLGCREYRRKYGLKATTSLASPSLRLKFQSAAKSVGSARNLTPFKRGVPHPPSKSQGATGEWQNAKSLCQAQIMSRFYSLRDRLGRVPTAQELEASGVVLHTLRRRFAGKTYREFVAFCGEIPHKSGGSKLKYSAQLLVELLRDLYVKTGRIPTRTACRRGLLPSNWVFVKRFGSWTLALEAAGLLHEAIKQRRTG